MADDLDTLLEAARAATKGPWRWWTSNSFRRLSSDLSGKDGDVLSAFVARDGVPDIAVNEANARHIATSSPDRIIQLVEELREARCLLSEVVLRLPRKNESHAAVEVHRRAAVERASAFLARKEDGDG